MKLQSANIVSYVFVYLEKHMHFVIKKNHIVFMMKAAIVACASEDVKL